MKRNSITFKNAEIDLELDFSIKDYEFPDILSGWDGNWLVVQLECRYRGQVFKSKTPSITTHELKEICQWFKSIAVNTIPEYTVLSFTEPNIEFRLFHNKSGKIRFGILLNAESKPPFSIQEFTIQPVDLDEDYVLVFENSFKEISTYATNFQNLLTDFPSRGEL